MACVGCETDALTEPIFSIRRATRADTALVAEMRLQFLRETAGFFGREVTPDLEAATRGYVAEAVPKNEFVAWLAEAGGQVIGTSGLVFFRRAPTPDNLAGLDAYVLNMYTVPSWRGRGVATALLKTTLEYVRKTPARRVFLRATEAGRALYEKLGFVSDDEIMSLSLDGV